jgi:F-type H+-transporting ATPase subunit delta
MSSEAVARRYARALFELAKEQGKVPEVTRQVGDFADAYESSTDLRELEHSPSLSDADREAIITELGSRMGAADITTRTVAMLATRQRLSVLPDLARQLDEMADDHLDIIRAQVTAANALSDSYLERLKRTIADATGKNVLLTFEQDPTLIAGIVTKIGDRIIDGSVRGRLERLADSIRRQ